MYDEDIAFCPRDGAALGERLLDQRYRIVSKLGSGGMGTVYLAEHVALGKRVAVKVLKPEVSRDPAMARRFEQEAVAASRIGQENIVDVTDFGHTPEGSLYFVMEYLEGRTLAEVLQRERLLPVGRACAVLVQICQAIEAAHARGIVHRDLKPHNIVLLDRAGRPDFVKVLDFGISKMGWRQEPITEQGAILGTPEYMAPEQASGESVDPRTDVYAIGVIAYELVTGTLPFRGDHSVATMLKHINEQPEPPRRRRPDLPIPEELEGAIMKALSKKMDDRQATVSQLRVTFARHLTAPIPLATEVPASAPTAEGRTLADRPSVAATSSEAFADTLASAAIQRRSPVPYLIGLAALGAVGAALALRSPAPAPAPQDAEPPPPPIAAEEPAPAPDAGPAAAPARKLVKRPGKRQSPQPTVEDEQRKDPPPTDEKDEQPFDRADDLKATPF
jgi:serine/threonine-protein kinase